jgi:dTDP-4-amino-4,6-dideoxygalactose transaminase
VLTKKTRAVIVPHLFGNPADIQAIVELAQSRNICVIDDAAQAFGASIGNQPVGSFGNCGVVSFGDEKICPSIGGVLLSRDQGIFSGRSKVQLTPASCIETLRKCFATLIWHHWRNWSAPLSKLCFSHPDPSELHSPYRRESMANLYAAVAVTLVERLSEHIAARRERVRAYQNHLEDIARLKLIPHRSGSACLSQVVRILPKKKGRDVAAELGKALAANGYKVRGSYVPLHLIPGLSSCVWDRLPYADRVWSDLIELPCEPSVSFEDVARIAAIVAATVKA